ncbi:MAG: Antitoxin VbhA [Acidimicrobiaceae bacterium]|jgi:hypothetical protein|nr:Antitoxin VbhA [Acidimicrobiaceae bacterium]
MGAMAQVVTKVDDVPRRAAAIEQARASARLEGLELDSAAVALTERYAAGDLTSDDLLDEMIHLPL